MVVPMEQWAGQPFQDKSADLWVVMLSDHNEKYSDRMERSYKAFAVTFELRFPFPLRSRTSNYIPSHRICGIYLLELHEPILDICFWRNSPQMIWLRSQFYTGRTCDNWIWYTYPILGLVAAKLKSKEQRNHSWTTADNPWYILYPTCT